MWFSNLFDFGDVMKCPGNQWKENGKRMFMLTRQAGITFQHSVINILHAAYFHCENADLWIEGLDIGKKTVLEMFALSGLHWTINTIQENADKEWENRDQGFVVLVKGKSRI